MLNNSDVLKAAGVAFALWLDANCYKVKDEQDQKEYAVQFLKEHSYFDLAVIDLTEVYYGLM